MTARLHIKPYGMAVAGAVICLLSLLPGWLTLRPTRISDGVSYNVWQLSVPMAVTIAAAGLAALAIGFGGNTRKGGAVMGLCASVLLAAAFTATALGARQLLQGQTEIARVSLGGGFWMSCGGIFVLLYAARMSLRDARLMRELLTWTPAAVFLAFLIAGQFSHLSIAQEFAGRQARFWQELRNHVALFAGSTVIGTLIGIPLGVWATRSRRVETPVFYIVGIAQTIPSLALFGLLIAPLSALSFAVPALREAGIRGVGNTPAIIALVIYSLLPIARNTFTGLKQVDAAAIDAGFGMGMSRRQVLRRVEAPLAAPLILEGVRTAAVQAVGLTAVAALIGAGGLGWFVFQGLGQAANDLILLGALPVIALAFAVDGMMRLVVKAATPHGLEARA